MEILIAVCSFIFGYFAEKILDKILEKTSASYHTRSNKKKKSKNIDDWAIDAIFTGDIYPFISPENVWVRDSDRRELFLAFPQDLRSGLKGNEGSFCSEDNSFCRFTLPGYEDEAVISAIELARKEIAQKFIDREDGLYFNGDKYGVFYLDTRSRSTDTKEAPQLLLEVFRTDHFTHRVITRATEILNPSVDMFNTDSLNRDLTWIRTSFGISIIVVLESVNQIILTHRSKNASFSEGKNWIYVSATEAFSESDIDEYESCPDLTLCVRRGIKEELGIDSNMYSQGDIRFHDCFFETHFYQDGIVASVHLKQNILPQDILSLRAKDKMLEIHDMFFIDNTKSAIQKFIKENKSEMRSQTVFSLESYMSTL